MQTQLIILEVVIFFPNVRMSKNRAWNYNVTPRT
jgi:hypothetical protein